MNPEDLLTAPSATAPSAPTTRPPRWRPSPPGPGRPCPPPAYDGSRRGGRCGRGRGTGSALVRPPSRGVAPAVARAVLRTDHGPDPACDPHVDHRAGRSPTAAQPAIDYIDGNVFVGIFGEHLALPPGTNAVVRAPGGGLVVATAERPHLPVFLQGLAGRLFEVDQRPDLTAQNALGCGAMQFAVSADGTQAAYWRMTRCDPTQGGALTSAR